MVDTPPLRPEIFLDGGLLGAFLDIVLRRDVMVRRGLGLVMRGRGGYAGDPPKLIMFWEWVTQGTGD